MRVFGVLLAIFGLLVAGVTAIAWVLAYRDLMSEPNAGHFLVPFTAGALLFFAGGMTLAIGGVALFVRAKRRNPGGR